MFTIERLRRETHGLPLLVRGGIVGLVLAGLADVMAHTEVAAHAGHLHDHASGEFFAHLAGFVSMVVIYLGVVLEGVRQSRLRRGSAEDISKGVA
jgi:hypothetical protein